MQHSRADDIEAIGVLIYGYGQLQDELYMNHMLAQTSRRRLSQAAYRVHVCSRTFDVIGRATMVDTTIAVIRHGPAASALALSLGTILYQ